ncbi:DNA polymerase III subunit beta [Nonomuraea bangladeshensis]|uniref:DNA polymerase III subunit beta n=1 Tax=Nonomuraea bangladeshensis TaxID=404385 RepID=UPI003C2AFF63
MKFTIMAGELADAVGWAAHALPKRPASPVLAGVLVDVDKDWGETIRVSAFDYDTSRTMQVQADSVGEHGRILVPGRLLADVVKVFPKTAFVDVTADGREILLRCGKAEYALLLLDVDDYPSLPKTPPLVGSVDAAELAEAVAHAAVAAGRDNTLPMLTGVRLEVGDGPLDLAATDRYRMAWRQLGWTRPIDRLDAKVEAVIPSRPLADAVKGFPSGPVELHLNDSIACLVGEDRTVTVRLLDPQFVNFRSHFSREPAGTVEVDAAELVNVVRRVSLLAERSTPVRLSFRQGEVLVEAGGGAMGRGSELAECKLDGDDMQVAFNPGYLLDGLAAAGGTATLHLGEKPTTPVIVTGTGDPAFKYVVIPIRLS